MGRSRGKIPNHKWDILCGITAVVIFIMAVMALSNPDENKVLFPFVFFFAALLRVLRFIERRMEEGRGKYIQLGIATVLFALSVISGISLWA